MSWTAYSRYIVASNTGHNLFLGQLFPRHAFEWILIYLAGEFKKAYPQAKLIGTDPLVNKRKDLKFDGGGNCPRSSACH
jgi:hypothetical protein